MSNFSNDVDLAKYEPEVFQSLWFPGQTLCRGVDGVIANGVLSSAGTSFTTCGVQSGHVVVLTYGSDLDGCYEVVSVESTHELRLSLVRGASDDPVVSPPAGTAVGFRISTFDPQAQEAAHSLLQYFGLTGAGEESPEDAVLDPRAMRAASVFAVLTAVFAARATDPDDVSGYWAKTQYYQHMLEAVRPRIRTAMDRNGDGIGDDVLTGAGVRLRRF
jgi:hypothetical protein